MDPTLAIVAICKVIEKSLEAGIAAHEGMTPEHRAKFWDRHFAMVERFDLFLKPLGDLMLRLSRAVDIDDQEAQP